MNTPARKAIIDRAQALPLTKQCQLVEVSRSSIYYQPVLVSDEDQALMRIIDKIHLKRPFLGSRRIRDELIDLGHQVNRKKVQRLMQLMGIKALYPKPSTSKRSKKNKIYPYLLRHLEITQPNHVWASDITYIPMARGFLYLVVIMDWSSRRVLSYRVSNTMESDFCVEALEEALSRYGKPEIFNTDQGAQFTSAAFTGVLKSAGISNSMDGKGCWVDNVFVERLWRSLKYEEVYLKAYDCTREARAEIGAYFEYYNTARRHQGLDRQTPDEAYFDNLNLSKAA